ncbi:MAG: hypothetical protein J6D02_13500 [Lachnospira sp.]|nr:hypothetical protein [Lachnospira sp.]
MSTLFLAFMNPILLLIKSHPDTLSLSTIYLNIVVCSGPFILISNCYANIIRTEGTLRKVRFDEMLLL